MRYVDPDGRSDVVEVGLDLFDIWVDGTPKTSVPLYRSAFTNQFATEYDVVSKKIKYFKTFGSLFVPLLNNIPGGIGISAVFEATVLGTSAYLTQSSNVTLIGETPFDYLRTTEAELTRLSYLINTEKDTGFVAFLQTQKNYLEQEYKANKYNIYKNNIPGPRLDLKDIYGCYNPDDSYYTEGFYQNYNDVIEYFGFDTQGKVLPQKMINYIDAYRDFLAAQGVKYNE